MSQQRRAVVATVPGVAIQMINEGYLTPYERATLQKIKHANDPKPNPSWGSNPYAGPEDHTAEALGAMGKIRKNQLGRKK